MSRKVCLEGGASARAEVSVARMVVLMVVCFLTGWLPYAGLAMVVVFRPDVHISPLVATLPVYLAKSSTLFNPLVYIFLNKQVTGLCILLLKHRITSHVSYVLNVNLVRV